MQKARTSLITVRPIQWTWSEIKGKKHPIKLVVTYQRQKQYYPVQFENENLYLTKSEWTSIDGEDKHPRGRLLKIKEAIGTAKASAMAARDKVTENNAPFTFERFKNEYLDQASDKGFLQLFSEHLEALRSDGRIGTWKAYSNAFAAFNEFLGGKRKRNGSRKDNIVMGRDISPVDLTPAKLKDFESHMKGNGLGKNSIAMYMRSLKVIYNLAADKNPSLKETYPFATKVNQRNKYAIKTGAGKKGEALSVDEIQAFMGIETESGLPDHEAKQYFLFSFLAQGMNLRDIFLLRRSDIDLKHGIISYVRAKTKDTERDEDRMEIPLTDAIIDIINDIGGNGRRPTDYVFPVLDNRDNLETQDWKIRKKIDLINRNLKALCTANDIQAVTSYAARHSYASLMKEAGESVELIRELLGHSDIRTTERYLKRFDIGMKRKANERLAKMLRQA